MKEDQSDIVYLMPFLEHAASQSAVVVEIGCGNGNGSTRALARGIARATEGRKLFISVDIDPERPAEKPDLPYWHMVCGASEDQSTVDAVEKVLRYQNVDLFFIDTIHTYEHLRREIELWQVLGSPTTTWLFHDTWIWGPYNSMTDAAKEYAMTNCLRYDDVSKLSHGLGMVSIDGNPGWPRPEGVDDQCPKL